VLVRYDKLNSTKHEVDLQFSASNLAKKHFCGENKNFLEIYKPKSAERLSTYIGSKKSEFDFLTLNMPEDEWHLVHRTEYISSNKYCEWAPLKKNKVEICSGVDDMPLLLKVMDYAMHNGKHKLVGGLVKTFAELRQAHAQSANFELKKKDRPDRGYLKLITFKESTLRSCQASSTTSLITLRAVSTSRSLSASTSRPPTNSRAILPVSITSM
jgi:hypothetical protein